MQLASNHIYIGQETQEPITQDEVTDGIANCAMEQAEIWAEAARNGETSIDPDFIANLVKMGNKQKGTKQKVEHHDSHVDYLGVFSGACRVQPRYEQGRASHYDSMVRKKIMGEKRLISANRDAFINRMQKAEEGTIGVDQYLVSNLYFQTGEVPQFDDGEVLCLKVGSRQVHAGFCGNDAPRAVFPTVVGRPRHKGVMVGMGQKDAYVGDEAQAKRGILTRKFPVQQGVIVNYDDYEKVLFHALYYELRVAPEEHPVILALDTFSSRAEKSKLIQIMFETFNVPALSLYNAQIAALYSNGMDTGLVVDIGAEFIKIVPVYKSTVLMDGAKVLPYGSEHITDYLMKILSERGYSFTTTAERDIVEDIKSKLCKVSLDFLKDLSEDTSSGSYELPDGQVITVGNEQFRAIEALFQPSFLGLESEGLVESIFDSVKLFDQDLKQLLLSSIVLSGGGSLTQGLSERLENEILSIVSYGKVYAPPERKYSTWIGTSILGTLGSFPESAIYKSQYDELGPDGCEVYFNFNAFATDVDVVKEQTAERKKAYNIKESQETEHEPEAKPEPIETKPEEPEEEPDMIESVMVSTNVIHVPYKSLADDVPIQTGDSTECKHCGACLNMYSNIKNIEEELYEWTCGFCKNTNEVFIDDELIKQNTIEYILQPGNTNEVTDDTYQVLENNLVIFCIDISGSMNSGNRLTQLKNATEYFLNKMSHAFPNMKPVILTFHDDITVVSPDGKQHDYELRVGNKPFETIFEDGVSFARKEVSSAIESRGKLINRVRNLSTQGCTALGPAVSFALGMASTQPGAKILLCTDGCANRGFGAIENGVMHAGKAYEQIATKALEVSATINVLSIRGDDCKLEYISKLADTTHGVVEIVDTQDLQKTVDAVMSKKLLGVGVTTHIKIDNRFTFENEHNSEIRELGNVTEDTDLTFRFKMNENIQDTQDALIQIIHTYSKADDSIVKRVTTTKTPLTTDRDLTEENMRPYILAMAGVHQSARLADNKLYQEARVNLFAHQRLIQRGMKSKVHQKEYINYIVQAERLDGFIRTKQYKEEVLGESISVDDYAAKNITQMKNAAAILFMAN